MINNWYWGLMVEIAVFILWNSSYIFCEYYLTQNNCCSIAEQNQTIHKNSLAYDSSCDSISASKTLS